MRTAFLIVAIGAFLGLAAVDLTQGHFKPALAEGMLAALNGLLLS